MVVSKADNLTLKLSVECYADYWVMIIKIYRLEEWPSASENAT